MTDTQKTKPAFIIRDFADAGTTQRFTKGAIVEIEEGAFGNYAAAGLVRVPTEEDRAAARAADTAEVKPAEPATAKTKA